MFIVRLFTHCRSFLQIYNTADPYEKVRANVSVLIHP